MIRHALLYSILSILLCSCGVTERQAKKEFEEHADYFQQLAADTKELRSILGWDFILSTDRDDRSLSFGKKDVVAGIYESYGGDTWKKGLPAEAIALVNKIYKDWKKARYEKLTIWSDDMIVVILGETMSSTELSFQYSLGGTPDRARYEESLGHDWLLVTEVLEWAIS